MTPASRCSCRPSLTAGLAARPAGHRAADRGHLQRTQPLVGEVVGLRSFRVDEAGRPRPLHSDTVWYDGPNTAVCTPPTGDRRLPHTVPDDGCECGFYAFGTREAAGRTRQMRYVQAVVSCWGGVVAGTRGVRAQYARIDALCLPPTPRRRSAVASRSATPRRDCSPTPRPWWPSIRSARRPATAGGAAVPLAVGCARSGRGRGIGDGPGFGVLPYSLLRSVQPLFELWLGVTVLAVVASGWPLVGSRGVGHRAAAYVVAGVAAWLVAPVFGLWGWLLRLPLLRGLLVTGLGLAAGLIPHHFPVVPEPKRRTFRGVAS